jgi:hypothetical protein
MFHSSRLPKYLLTILLDSETLQWLFPWSQWQGRILHTNLTLQDIDSLSTGLSDNAIIGTSLYVSWQPPRVDTANGRPDIVGSGGDAVSSFLVEWSRISFDSFNPAMVKINVKRRASRLCEGTRHETWIGCSDLNASEQPFLPTFFQPHQRPQWYHQSQFLEEALVVRDWLREDDSSAEEKAMISKLTATTLGSSYSIFSSQDRIWAQRNQPQVVLLLKDSQKQIVMHCHRALAL